MPRFVYKAVAPSGEVVEGELEAADESAAIRLMQSRGQIPIRAVAASESAVKSGGVAKLKRKRIGSGEIAAFTRELATLVGAGLPLDRGMQVLIDLADNVTMREMIERVQEQVRGGKAFSKALEAENKYFSRLYINLVRAGETGGALDTTLARLADYLESMRARRDHVISALIYPLILLVVAGLSVFILLTVVVPKFSKIFEDMGQALPLATQFVIRVGELFNTWWWVMALAIAATVVYFRRQFADPVTRQPWDRRILRLPLVGDLVSKVEMARFSQTLSTLLSNGVPLLTGLAIVKEIMANRVLAEAVGRAAEQLKQGKGLSGPMKEAKVFPRLAVHMISVGEESGQMEGMLNKVAEVYDREVKASVQRMLALVEPIMIIGLGLVIAGIIVSILLAVLAMTNLAV